MKMDMNYEELSKIYFNLEANAKNLHSHMIEFHRKSIENLQAEQEIALTKVYRIIYRDWTNETIPYHIFVDKLAKAIRETAIQGAY